VSVAPLPVPGLSPAPARAFFGVPKARAGSSVFPPGREAATRTLREYPTGIALPPRPPRGASQRPAAIERAAYRPLSPAAGWRPRRPAGYRRPLVRGGGLVPPGGDNSGRPPCRPRSVPLIMPAVGVPTADLVGRCVRSARPGGGEYTSAVGTRGLPRMHTARPRERSDLSPAPASGQLGPAEVSTPPPLGPRITADGPRPPARTIPPPPPPAAVHAGVHEKSRSVLECSPTGQRSRTTIVLLDQPALHDRTPRATDPRPPRLHPQGNSRPRAEPTPANAHLSRPTRDPPRFPKP